MTNKINKLRNYIVSLPLCLTGCMGVYENGFECPPGKGVGCKSISEVNRMVDQAREPSQTPVIWFNPWSHSLKGSSCSQTDGCKTEGLDVTNSI